MASPQRVNGPPIGRPAASEWATHWPARGSLGALIGRLSLPRWAGGPQADQSVQHGEDRGEELRHDPHAPADRAGLHLHRSARPHWRHAGSGARTLSTYIYHHIRA
eukprot:9495861-Pyramimonas_sp.AAC.2